MEEYHEIEVENNFLVYGVLNSQIKTNKLIIFVNGLGTTIDRHTSYNAARFSPKKGFDTFRYNGFSRKQNERKLSDSSITTFTKDLNSIVSFFRKKYEKIYLVGASLGGCVVINSNHENVEKIVLWDPAIFLNDSITKKFNKNRFVFNKSLDKFIINSDVEYLVSKELVEERNEQDERLIKKIQKPTKFIMAEKFFMKDLWKKYLNSLKVSHQFIIIEGAGHGFDEEGIEDKLFEETLNFLKND